MVFRNTDQSVLELGKGSWSRSRVLGNGSLIVCVPDDSTTSCEMYVRIAGAGYESLGVVDDSISAASLSPDRSKMAIALRRSNVIELRDLPTGESRVRLAPPPSERVGEIVDICFSNDSKMLCAVANRSRDVYLWSLPGKSYEVLTDIWGRPDSEDPVGRWGSTWVKFAGQSPQEIITGAGDELIRYWQLNEGRYEPVGYVRTSDGPPYYATLDEQQTTLYVTCNWCIYEIGMPRMVPKVIEFARDPHSGTLSVQRLGFGDIRRGASNPRIHLEMVHLLHGGRTLVVYVHGEGIVALSLDSLHFIYMCKDRDLDNDEIRRPIGTDGSDNIMILESFGSEKSSIVRHKVVPP